MKKLIAFTLLVATLFCLTISVSAEAVFDEVEEPKIGGKYYLCATVDGTDYYYRVTSGARGESVTDTNPYSLYVTSDTEDKNVTEFTLEKLVDGFSLCYPSGQNTRRIYSADITMNGQVDTGINSTLTPERHCFYWDGTNKMIFCMKNGAKHVLAVKPMKNKNTGEEALHMLSVPVKEVKDGKAVAVRFVSTHEHKFSNKLTGNEYSHWFPCPCGEKGDLQMHQVDSWTVTKEAAVGTPGSRTGVCTVCGETAVEEIPALKDKNDKKEEADEAKTALTLDPVVIAVAAVLVVAGVVILIFGRRHEKKKQEKKD